MTVEQEIRRKLMQAFAPTRLEVVNESHLHAGHAASPGTGNSHFQVVVVSARFVAEGRLARHRMINDVLAAELAGPVHALSVTALAPGEGAP